MKTHGNKIKMPARRPTLLEFVMRRRMKTAEGARNLVTVLEKSSRGDAFMLW